MILIDKEQLLSDIVNLPSQLGISSKGVDATYMDGYLSGKAQRQLEIIDIVNKQQVAELEKPKKKRKFRAMTVSEWCSKGIFHKSEYYLDERGKMPYKTKDGKYILREVKE